MPLRIYTSIGFWPSKNTTQDHHQAQVAVGEQNLRYHDGVADQLAVLHRLRKAALVGGLDLIVQFLHEGRSRQVDQLLRGRGTGEQLGWKQEHGKQKEEQNVKCS